MNIRTTTLAATRPGRRRRPRRRRRRPPPARRRHPPGLVQRLHRLEAQGQARRRPPRGRGRGRQQPQRPTWRWVLRHNGSVSARGWATTRTARAAPSRSSAGWSTPPAPDNIVFQARNPARRGLPRRRPHLTAARPVAPILSAHAPPVRASTRAHGRSPVAQFLAVGLVALAAIVLGAGCSAAGRPEEAISDARATTRLLARSVAEPAIPRGAGRGTARAVDRFDRRATERLLVGDVRRIKIWSADGTIVYSDRPS